MRGVPILASKFLTVEIIMKSERAVSAWRFLAGRASRRSALPANRPRRLFVCVSAAFWFFEGFMSTMRLHWLCRRLGRPARFALLALVLAGQAHAQSIETIDLAPFVGPSPFDEIGAAHLLPRGRQVLDGVPFQIDGVVFLEGNGKGRTNIHAISIGQAFDLLHFLAAAHNGGVSNGTLIARVRLVYADQTAAALDLRFGVQMRRWYGQWHQKREAATDTNCTEAWDGLASDPAKSENILRLYHVVLANPFPDRPVASLSVETAKSRCGLLMAGLSVGPAQTQRLADTVAPLRRPIPDVSPRKGELASGQGVVKTPTGEPVPGALVRVIGARNFKANFDDASVDDPAVGLQTSTGANGFFTLPPMPDNRLYTLVIAAEGFETLAYGGEDPKFDPIDIRLQRFKPPVQPAPKYALHGRVVGPNDQPVPFVWVERDGIAVSQGRGWGWENEGWPKRVLTDTNGEFTFARDKAFQQIQARLHAPGLAPFMQWLDATNLVQTVKLGVGAVVRGRVLQDGQPLAGVRVGVSGEDRNLEVYAGHFEARTKEDGTFEFPHLQANTGWFLYGVISSFKNHAALASRHVRTAADSTTNDLGDLATTPGLHLAGAIKTRHGEPLPKGLTVDLDFDVAWDSQSAKVKSDGHFRFDGLYPATVNISVEADHWRLSGANRSYDLWNPFQLTGLFERNKDDLEVEIEKGDDDYNGNDSQGNGQLPAQDKPDGRPIEGSEASGTPRIVLDGQVVDDDTGRLLPRFKVVPGYQPPRAPAAPKPMIQELLKPFARKSIPWNELPCWDYRREGVVSNGVFSLQYLTLSSKPIFRIEAEGYQPYQSEPIAVTTKNLLVRLKHGVGPNGVVLLPDGEPAEHATVVYAASHDSFNFDNKKIGPNGLPDTNGQIFQVTGKAGTFSFQPRSEGRTIFVSHPAGWAEEDVSRGGNKLKLRLMPWACVVGTLVFSNGTPAGGEVMGVNMGNDWMNGDPMFYFQQTTTTDPQGRFEFQGLPPRRLHIERRVSVRASAWRDIEQTRLDARPGETNDLGKVIFDTPPSLPLGEEIKQKLGLGH
jgi:uncharacterized GH25 family protein